MRRVEQIMGLPISIDIPNCEDGAIFEAAFSRLSQIDERYSTYKPESEVSRYIKDEVSEDGLSPELKKIIRACRRAEKLTGGYFSAWADGTFNPSGYVKGWAIAEAGEIIEKAGFKTYCIGAGGDILARSDSEKVWNIGIQDPGDKTKILNPSTGSGQASILKKKNGAVATSGSYERGAHIINPKTKKPAKELLSVTVTGPDIIWADILATAIFASGKPHPEFLKNFPAFEALTII